MPELPDVVVYVEALERRLPGALLHHARLVSPFVLRSVDPPLATLEARRVRGVDRIGKRIVLAFDDDLYLVIHLMIAGRLRWREGDVKSNQRLTLASLAFSSGTLLITEASGKRRASIHVVRGRAALSQFDRGGIDVLGTTREAFTRAVTRENHTLKRVLTDPRFLSGIGNAYSDEILHAARLSPLKRTRDLRDDEMVRLYHAARSTIASWIDALRREAAGAVPEKVTAFREGMAVHGRYGRPCPDCGAPVQRIRYAENEVNYCARCQTGGRVLADRSLSRVLRGEWPRSIDELEEPAIDP